MLQALGERYVEEKDWKAAERVLSRLVDLQPSNPAYEALASVYQQEGQHDEWLKTMEAFLETPESGLSHALFAVAFGDVQWNRLGSPQPLIPDRSIDAGQPFGNPIGKLNVFGRETIHVESFVVESRFGHRDSFKYEYRFTEYKYESLS